MKCFPDRSNELGAAQEQFAGGGRRRLWRSLRALAALGSAALPASAAQLLLVGAVVALALPPFRGDQLLAVPPGPTGILRSWLPLQHRFRCPARAWMLALHALAGHAARSFRAPGSGWSRQMLEATWPCAAGHWSRICCSRSRAALLTQAAVYFVLALNNFAVPAILQVKVYAGRNVDPVQHQLRHRAGACSSAGRIARPRCCCWSG